MGTTSAIDHAALKRKGRNLEYFTIGWNSLEGLVAIIAGAIAASISLVGFGIDSLVEVTSGAALLWRMSSSTEDESRERLTLRGHQSTERGIVGRLVLGARFVGVQR